MNSDVLNDFFQFLKESPTSWHAALEIGNRFAQQDFCPLEEDEKWDLTPGDSYFIQRGGSICAFTLPKKAPQKATILASHTDSPALKLKPRPVFVEEGLPFLRVETYGGPILSTWINRDLAIAGRVLFSAGGAPAEKLLFLDDAPVIIPTLAIHLDKETNQNPKKIDKQHHLCPLIGAYKKDQNPQKVFEQLIGMKEKDILGTDLYLVPLEEPRLLGPSLDLISSYRIDNLESSHAALLALLSAKSPSQDTIQMAIFWNHEEIGSATDEGAHSPFLIDTLKRISLSHKADEEDFLRLKQRSQIVSIDVAHAFHPGYKSKYDKDNAPHAGKGVVIKYDANQRYATSGLTAASIAHTCKEKKIPYQSFASESNLSSGSTVGVIAASQTGIPTVDIGLAQFSMHATREIIATEDHLHLCHCLKALLEN